MSLPLQAQLDIEEINIHFEEALEKEDQLKAEGMIDALKRRGLYDEANSLDEILFRQEWYCDECRGTGEVDKGEFDNIIKKPCVCRM